MGVPSGPQSPSSLLCGDYLRVAALRPAVVGHGVDAGFARIERVELLPVEQVDAVCAERLIGRGLVPVPVVWCHGLPGPVLVYGGDVQVLDVASPRRVEHDTQQPWWPSVGETPLLRGAHPAGGAQRRSCVGTPGAAPLPGA